MGPLTGWCRRFIKRVWRPGFEYRKGNEVKNNGRSHSIACLDARCRPPMVRKGSPGQEKEKRQTPHGSASGKTGRGGGPAERLIYGNENLGCRSPAKVHVPIGILLRGRSHGTG